MGDAGRSVWGKAFDFYLKAILLTWVWWILPVFTGTAPLAGKVFLALGGAMPLVCVLFVLGSRERRVAFLKRFVDFRTVSWKGYVIIFFLFPASNLVALLLHTGGTFPSDEFALFSSYWKNPTMLFPFLLFMLFFGPITEEPAWRGLVPDMVRERVSFWHLSFISAFFWALWHLPLFFMEGSYQHRVAAAGAGPLINYVAAFFPHAFLMILFYDRYQRSVLSAVLIHWSANTWGELFGIPEEAKIWRTVIEAAAVAAIILMDNIKEKNGKTK